MAILRRRGPTGRVQRLPLGPNLVADCVFRFEGRASAIADAPASSENLAGLLADRFIRQESSSNVSRDSLPPLESLVALSVDPTPEFEFAGSASVLSDALARLEWRTILLVDPTPEFEFGSTVINDGIKPLEALNTLLPTDAVANLEVRRVAISDALVELENNGQTLAVGDAIVALENLIVLSRDVLPTLENASRVLRDGFPPLESQAAVGTTSVTQDIFAGLEFLSSTRGGRLISVIELLSRVGNDAVAALESLGVAALSVDSVIRLENLASLFSDAVGRMETLASVRRGERAAFEALSIVGADGTLPIAIIGSVSFQSDALFNFEYRGMYGTDVSLPSEFGKASRVDAVSPIESLISAIQHSSSPLEALAGLIARFGSGIEFLSLHPVTADEIFNTEVSGVSTNFPDLLLGVIEFNAGVASDPLAAIESTAIVGFPFDPETPFPIEAGYLVLDKTHTNLSIGRVRPITAPYTSPGIQAPPFDPLAVGTIDTFAFDFTPDAGGATIAATTWTATFDPGSSGAIDDVAQARVITAWAPGTVYVDNPIDGVLQKFTGAYFCAVIGTFPVSAIGGVYTLTARVTLSDTRILTVTSKVLCVAQQS
jgi:hypothetical protein